MNSWFGDLWSSLGPQQCVCVQAVGFWPRTVAMQNMKFNIVCTAFWRGMALNHECCHSDSMPSSNLCSTKFVRIFWCRLQRAALLTERCCLANSGQTMLPLLVILQHDWVQLPSSKPVPKRQFCIVHVTTPILHAMRKESLTSAQHPTSLFLPPRALESWKLQLSVAAGPCNQIFWALLWTRSFDCSELWQN